MIFLEESWQKIFIWLKSLTIREIWLGIITISVISMAVYGIYDIKYPDNPIHGLWGLTKNLGSQATLPSSSDTTTSSTDQSNNQSTSSTNQSTNGSGDTSANGNGQSNGSDSNGNGPVGLSSCGSNYSFFTAAPVNMDNYYGLIPLGNLNPSGHTFPTDHIYFAKKSESSSASLYAPGNATITKISVSQNLTAGTSDYSITFKPCSDLEAYFLHVLSVSQKLSDVLVPPFSWDNTYTTGGSTFRNYGKNVSVSINAGEQIGTVKTFDLGAYDTRTNLSFANPSRWTSLSKDHTVCPINYYSGSLKTTLMALFGDWDGDPRRTIAPICGTIEQDVADTAQGAWFKKGTASWQNEDEHLALVHDNVNPNIAKFSMGTSAGASGLSSGIYEFYPQGSGLVNRDFDDVRSDNNIYCYDVYSWRDNDYISIVFQLTSNDQLRIEKNSSSSCGSGPWSFTDKYTDFER